MTYILVLITILQGGDISINHEGTYPTMMECFDERETLVEEIGRPIINYQAICLLRDTHL